MRPHGERWRAPYASDPAATRGRLHPEPPSPTRSEYQRDRDRIIHSAAFRRLTHKTQVFIFHEGDHYRTRLTHTLEVSQIARSIARSLGLDEDLAEAIALGHDLGHTPFGHTGEDALAACMAPFGGFDHNAQALRAVTSLERRYAAFDGLNLAFETVEGLVKHNGPLVGPDGTPAGRYRTCGLPAAVLDYDRVVPLGLATWPSGEAQAAAIADDIAYDAHDLDDGLRAGILHLDDVRSVPFLSGLVDEIEHAHPGLDPSRRTHELTRRVITRLVEDAIGEGERRLAGCGTVADVRAAAGPSIAFSDVVGPAEASVKAFLFPKLYRHPRLMSVRRDAEAVVRNLFERLFRDPGALPPEWQADAADDDEPRRARRVADYIAGMTDRFSMLEHARLFPTTPDLRIA